MSGARLPGAPEPTDRVVVHVDMDCFYASCERRREPSLEGEPVVVGMGFEPGETRGAVATASYEARAYGVESAQAISTALERLPRVADVGPDVADAGHYRPVDMAYYRSVSQEVRAVLEDVADIVRAVSIDEAYLDVTDEVTWTEAESFARDLRRRIAAEVGVPASVGVAPNMSTAKIASDADKPAGLVVVEPDAVEGFLAPLPIGDLHGVGPVRAGHLRELGIETVGELAAADPLELEDRFGDRGRELHRRARGVDERAVEPVGEPKSLSRESAFDEPTEDHDAVCRRVRTLAAAVAERAATKGALYGTIGIKVVTPPYDVNTRARSLSGPVEDPALVESVALDLLEEFADVAVRKVGVRVSKLSFTDRDQANLAAWEGRSADAPTADGTTRPSETHRTRRGQTRLGEFD